MYCKNCKKQVPDGKFCVFCGKEINNNKINGSNLFQTLMTIFLCIWLVIYIVISVIILYNANGRVGGPFDYSIAVSLLVIALDTFVIPCIISANLCIISKSNKNNNKIDIQKITAIILISVMIFFSIVALVYDDNSNGALIKLYVIPILVYSVISLVNIIIKIKNKKTL